MVSGCRGFPVFFELYRKRYLMMNIIRVLREEVASQIAAGEVVERPASVVRELIDNSIDAGADRINVSIERGGRDLIKVSDNGVGMSRDDLLLSVERHATSKIETASDLFSVKSFGFRGEALPSIASVSRMTIVSRVHDQVLGHKLLINAGKLVKVEETGAPPGTSVEVRSLFFNLPARRKFLRSTNTEAGHITDAFGRAALPFPSIGFKLQDKRKTVLHLPASDKQLNRLTALMGRKVAMSMERGEEDRDSLYTSVYLAPSDFARSRGDRLFVYVNGRYIRDRLITKAVIEGYGQRLMKGQYPQAVLFIKIDPSLVDVNVHPTKQEIRFHEGKHLFQAVASLVDRTLSQSRHRLSFPPPREGHQPPLPWEEAAFVREPIRDYSLIRQGVEITSPEAECEKVCATGKLHIIGQLLNTYILCQIEDGLLMIDQHAAHERIVYDHLIKGLKNSQVEVQGLLVPYELELTGSEKNTALEKREDLLRLGLDVEHFGGNTFILRSHPALLKNVLWDSFVPELLAKIDEKGVSEEELLENVAALIACHGAIRAGLRMRQEEMILLLDQLTEIDLPSNCPHGRPVYIQMTAQEIEKMFKRVV